MPFSRSTGTYQHGDLARVLGEEHCPLTGRVGAANDKDLLVPVMGRFGQSCSVVNPGPGQGLDTGHIKHADRDAGSKHKCAAGQLGPVTKP